MKVAELTGAQLDYWVAMADGLDAKITNGGAKDHFVYIGECCVVASRVFDPSGDWREAGRIIERERITIKAREDEAGPLGWAAFVGSDPVKATTCWGSTALVAAMRAYVASKFGEEVADHPV